MVTAMELSGTAYLYNLSLLATTFIGFSVIVLTLCQALGHKPSNFDALLAHLYMEYGLVIAVSSLLPGGGRVLEAGAGAGWHSLALARTGHAGTPTAMKGRGAAIAKVLGGAPLGETAFGLNAAKKDLATAVQFGAS